MLRRELPDLRAADWVRATAAGAALAWLIGMTPSSLHDTLATWPLLLLLPVGLLAGAALMFKAVPAGFIPVQRCEHVAGSVSHRFHRDDGPDRNVVDG